MEVVAREWFERRPNGSNDIDAMIHTLDCHHANPNNPNWRRFASLEASLAHYLDFAHFIRSIDKI